MAPISELGSNSQASESSRGGTTMGGLARELQKGGRLAPGAFAPREEVRSAEKSQRVGALKRKSVAPQRHAGSGGKRKRAPEEETVCRLEKEVASCEEKRAALESEIASERNLRVEAERAAKEARAELDRERSEAARERIALATTKNRLRSALEGTLRRVAETEAREQRRALGTAAFELGRAVYRSSFGARDAWEDGDAEIDLRRRAGELLARREALERRSPAWGGAAMIEAISDDEARKAHLAALKRDEVELASERAAVERRKLRHAREWTRARHEDASRFRVRPLMNDRYVLLSLLGKGGFSEVWLAYDLDETRKVAVKMHQLDRSWSDDKKRAYVRHAAREYSIQRDLDHPRVVRLFDVFEVDDDTFATVLEYCAGEDLDALLRARKTLPERDARAIMLQVLAGLHHLHSPAGTGKDRRAAIIHYDLKPGNILFDETGDAKITDFGLSKIIPHQNDALATSLELTSQGAGTYWYLPPECFSHAEGGAAPRINANVDVWSVGVITFQMLYGARPFGEGQTQQRLLSDRTMLRATNVNFPPTPAVSDQAKDFIRLCLRPSPADRPTVRDLCDHPYVKHHDAAAAAAGGT
ncbi:hypothetical protein CTAYLR_003288 [Chrysophaeum taylorii]|uniref:Protein kinase domain-containing protein n=1 Tax=Chrysophaeum taylorii TaxID=2483200 RepID=A0AAD7UAF0_9STRA|nr:hypothetical protein CTAYLR_003288 [Chrysophaeum taylorii]